MVSKNSESAKRQARDCYGRFASPSSMTAPPLSCQEVESSSHHRTTPPTLRMPEVVSSSRRCTAPPSRQEEASSDNSVGMWVVHRTTRPPLRLETPPPLARLVAPPPTHVEEVASDNSLLSNSSGYNDECSHVNVVTLSI
jgi:hypothetical protein